MKCGDESERSPGQDFHIRVNVLLERRDVAPRVRIGDVDERKNAVREHQYAHQQQRRSGYFQNERNEHG